MSNHEHDQNDPETHLSGSNVMPPRTPEPHASGDEHEERPTLGSVLAELGFIETFPDANNPHLWLDTLVCIHGSSNVTRMAHDPVSVVNAWEGVAAIHGMRFGCTCLLDYVRSYRRRYLP